MTIAFPALSILLAVTNVSAQSLIDISKYGQTGSYGTARSMGFGGALGSVGGDFSTLSVNPAGIGQYRSSEVMFTPGLRFSNNQSTYTGVNSDDNNVRFGFNNMGVIFAETPSAKYYDKADWKSTGFGFGLNRIANFDRTYNYKGQNYSSSASQYFEADALNNIDDYDNWTADMPAYLGYNSYLLSSANLNTYVPYTSGINQVRSVQEKGGITEMAISAGGNYQDQLLLGATLGIDFLNHRVSSGMYEETINPAVSDSFDNFQYNENFRTNGTGVNLKLGAIYKFDKYFRAGFAFHTPTLYSLKETSGSNISVNSKLYGLHELATPENQYEYTYITPMKMVASATGILGKYGFITADYEYVTYNTMRFQFENYPAAQREANNAIKGMYKAASNFRAGIELRYEQLMIRGGYGFYGSPFKSKLYGGDRNDFSVGLGYRFAQSFIDFAVTKSYYTNSEQPYELAYGYTQPPTATLKNAPTFGVITVGWKF